MEIPALRWGASKSRFLYGDSRLAVTLGKEETRQEHTGAGGRRENRTNLLRNKTLPSIGGLSYLGSNSIISNSVTSNIVTSNISFGYSRF